MTPAADADLRRLLGAQTRRRIGFVDLLKLSLPAAGAAAALERELAAGAEAVLFDALHEGHVGRVGELLDARVRPGRPLFSVGPSSIEAALSAGSRSRALPPLRPSSAPLLVASGSCSPVTAEQIAWALGHGFAEVELDVAAILRGDASALDSAADAAVRRLRRGRSVVLHTSLGPSDPRFAAARRLASRSGLDHGALGAGLGGALGRTVREIVRQTGLSRVVVTGGDTSSHAARALGVRSLEIAAAVTRGGPLCRVRAPGTPLDGCEVVFKGGQVGPPDYLGRFGRARRA